MILKQIFSIGFILIFCDMNTQINKNIKIDVLPLAENGLFPNNSELPVLIYKNIFNFSGSNPASTVETIFAKNSWGGSWRNGIYNYHHYHSTAHEALGVYAGWAEVQLGGPGNKPIHIEKGDLVVLPAGTAHKCIEKSDEFAVVGAYPDNQNWDMNYGKENETEKVKKNIAKVPLPKNDPVFGEKGKLFSYWN